MPVIVAVDHDRSEVKVVAIGPVTFEQALHQLDHEARAGGLDARGSDVLITQEENFAVAEKIRAQSRETALGPAPFVVSSDDVFDALNVLAELVEAVRTTRVLRDEREARTWLGLRERERGAGA